MSRASQGHILAQWCARFLALEVPGSAEHPGTTWLCAMASWRLAAFATTVAGAAELAEKKMFDHTCWSSEREEMVEAARTCHQCVLAPPAALICLGILARPRAEGGIPYRGGEAQPAGGQLVAGGARAAYSSPGGMSSSSSPDI